MLLCNINTPASGQRSCFLSLLRERTENRYPFFSFSLFVPPPLLLGAQIPTTCKRLHTVLAGSHRGGSLTDPCFRQHASTRCWTRNACRQPCTRMTNVEGNRQGGGNGGSGEANRFCFNAATSGLSGLVVCAFPPSCCLERIQVFWVPLPDGTAWRLHQLLEYSALV